MRNPHYWRAVGLWAIALGMPSLAAWFWVDAEYVGVRVALFFFGAVGVVFGGVCALLRHQDVRAKEALARAEGIITRWGVEAEDWQRFVAQDPRWSSHAQGRVNEFTPSEAAEANGVEVIVGKTAVQIGGSIHQVSPRSTPEITEARLHDGERPPVIELLLYHPAYAGPSTQNPARYTALRFPVGQRSLTDARRAVAHFRGDLPGEPDFFHGRGDGTDPEDLSRCYHCGYETHKLRSRCPKCGTSLQSRRWSRRFGLCLVLGGVIICGLMGFVLWDLGPSLLRPGAPVTGTRFTGTPEKARMLLGVFAAVLTVGLTALGYGLWQMFTGRRSKRVIYFLVALAGALWLLAFVI